MGINLAFPRRARRILLVLLKLLFSLLVFQELLIFFRAYLSGLLSCGVCCLFRTLVAILAAKGRTNLATLQCRRKILLCFDYFLRCRMWIWQEIVLKIILFARSFYSNMPIAKMLPKKSWRTETSAKCSRLNCETLSVNKEGLNI